MPATLTRPLIEGFDDVEAFAAQYGLTEALFVAYDITSNFFPMAERIHVAHYVDPEDGHESLLFIVSGAKLTVDEAVELHTRWNERVCQEIEPDALWRIGMMRESTE